jgi:hypothetical protein
MQYLLPEPPAISILGRLKSSEAILKAELMRSNLVAWNFVWTKVDAAIKTQKFFSSGEAPLFLSPFSLSSWSLSMRRLNYTKVAISSPVSSRHLVSPLSCFLAVVTRLLLGTTTIHTPSSIDVYTSVQVPTFTIFTHIITALVTSSTTINIRRIPTTIEVHSTYTLNPNITVPTATLTTSKSLLDRYLYGSYSSVLRPFTRPCDNLHHRLGCRRSIFPPLLFHLEKQTHQ